MSEELTTEDKKKAINLEDLVFVKNYIDGRHYKKTEIDTKFNDVNNLIGKTYTKVEADAKFYSKSQTDDKFYNKTEIDSNHYKKEETYNKTETDEQFYRKDRDVMDQSIKTASILVDPSTYEYASVRIKTQEEYDALTSVSETTLYFIKES